MNAREIMEAFLAGKKLINKNYKDENGEFYLYLESTGYIAEEDGAGAKSHRVPMFHEDSEYRVIE